MQLAESIFNDIQDLADQGNWALDEGRAEEAISLWQQALGLLPPPVHKWQAAFWFYASIGQAYYQLQRYDEAMIALKQATQCPEGFENPYPYYMIGKCCWQVGHERATTFLLRAYELDGERIFISDTLEGEQCLHYLYEHGLIERD